MGKPLFEAAAPAPSEGWRLLGVLIPRVRTVSPQGIVVLSDGSWVISQGDESNNLTLTRFDPVRLERLGELRIPRASHGDRLEASDMKVGVYVTDIWCEIPWQTGTLQPSTVVSKYKASRRRLPFAAKTWCQGEIVNLDGYALRLYGVPFRGYGPSVVNGVTRPNLPARIEYYQGSPTPVYVEKIGQLGRNSDGDPYDDRLEPEGLSCGRVGGYETLIVGIVTGRDSNGGFSFRIYGRPWRGLPD